MTAPAKRTATYADIEALPPHLSGEIINGVLYSQPRPVRRHGGASSVIGAISLNAYQLGIGGPGGWIFVDEPELHLGLHVVVPDIAGWRMERMTEPADKAVFGIAPDWICEVLSPATEKRDKGEKLRIYATYEVGYLWYVDPRARSLEVFRRVGRDWVLASTFFGSDEVNAEPFPALTFKLDLLWPFDRPVPPEGSPP